MPNSLKYTTISVERKTKTLLDYLRAKKGKSLSVIVHEMVKLEYEKEFGEVYYASTEENGESGAVPIVG